MLRSGFALGSPNSNTVRNSLQSNFQGKSHLYLKFSKKHHISWGRIYYPTEVQIFANECMKRKVLCSLFPMPISAQGLPGLEHPIPMPPPQAALSGFPPLGTLSSAAKSHTSLFHTQFWERFLYFLSSRGLKSVFQGWIVFHI